MKLVILKKRGEFQRVRGGVKWSGRGFLAEGRIRPEGDTVVGVRFGFTISKKVGIAVERNRIRRRLKAALRLMPAELAPNRMDIVIVARRAALDMEFTALSGDLDMALKRLRKPISGGGSKRTQKFQPAKQ